MTKIELETTARALVADGKGILAADESVATVTKRLGALEIESTSESRRAYREMFFTTPAIAEFISGVILQDETIHQRSSKGIPMADLLTRQGILPGIKVDTGAKPLAGCPGETDHRRAGRFAGPPEGIPWDRGALRQMAGGHRGKRYAPNRDRRERERPRARSVRRPLPGGGSGSHRRARGPHGRIARHRAVRGGDRDRPPRGLRRAPRSTACSSKACSSNRTWSIPGKTCARKASAEEVAAATLRCLRRHVPAAVPGIVFLSGGQNPFVATANLNAMNRLEGPKPWKLSFSYGRALQDEALEAWHGRRENIEAGQRAFHHRARCESAAALGKYTTAMEEAEARGSLNGAKASRASRRRPKGRSTVSASTNPLSEASDKELERDERLVAGVQLPFGRNDLLEGQPAPPGAFEDRARQASPPRPLGRESGVVLRLGCT